MRIRTKNKAQSVIEYAFLVVAITAAFIVMSRYIQKTVNSNLVKLEKEEKADERVYCDRNNPCADDACRPQDCNYCAYEMYVKEECDCSYRPCSVKDANIELIEDEAGDFYHKPCDDECNACTADCVAPLYAASSPALDTCKTDAHDQCMVEMRAICSFIASECDLAVARETCCSRCPGACNITPGPEPGSLRISPNRTSFARAYPGQGSFRLAADIGAIGGPASCYSDCMNLEYYVCYNRIYAGCAGACNVWDFETGAPPTEGAGCYNVENPLIEARKNFPYSDGYRIWSGCMGLKDNYNNPALNGDSDARRLDQCAGLEVDEWLAAPCALWYSTPVAEAIYEYRVCAEFTCGFNPCNN